MTSDQQEKINSLKEIISTITSFPKAENFKEQFNGMILTLENFSEDEELFENWYVLCLEDVNSIINLYIKWFQKVKIINNNLYEDIEKINDNSALCDNLFTNF